MEDIDGGLHPAVDGQSLDEDDVKSYFNILSKPYVTYGHHDTVISLPLSTSHTPDFSFFIDVFRQYNNI